MEADHNSQFHLHFQASDYYDVKYFHVLHLKAAMGLVGGTPALLVSLISTARAPSEPTEWMTTVTDHVFAFAPLFYTLG